VQGASGEHVGIRLAESPADMRTLLTVAEAVWGPPAGSMVSPDFLMALAHTGGYIAIAEQCSSAPPRAIGVSFGFLSRCGTGIGLHSHITGVVNTHQHRGIGWRLKQHQRSWALDRGITVITWTFDPLVRRNGWFNLHRLGATAEEFHIDFYGPLGDSINGDDPTDRLLARWDLLSARAISTEIAPLSPMEPTSEDRTVPTPVDIVDLRRTDPGAARTWRHRLRTEFEGAFATQHIVGMTADGDYVLRSRSADSRP